MSFYSGADAQYATTFFLWTINVALNCGVHNNVLVGNQISIECHDNAKNVNSIDHDECILDGNDESFVGQNVEVLIDEFDKKRSGHVRGVCFDAFDSNVQSHHVKLLDVSTSWGNI